MVTPPPPTAHDDDHARLLEQVACGDLDPTDPDVVRQTASCAACRAELAELLELRQLLDADAATERAALASTTHVAPTPTRPRPRRLLRRAVAACAAALALLAVGRLAPTCNQPPQPPVLLGSPIELLAPTDDARSFSGFRWSGDLPRGGSYHLQVWPADAAADAPPLLERRDLGAAEYHPTAAELSRLPTRIDWRIQAWDIDGHNVGSSPREPARIIRDD